MSAALALAIVATLMAAVAVLASIGNGRQLSAVQAELAHSNAALETERLATAESIAAVHRSTVEEVAALLKNVLVQVDTELVAKVAEALALLHPSSGSDVDGVNQTNTE